LFSSVYLIQRRYKMRLTKDLWLGRGGSRVFTHFSRALIAACVCCAPAIARAQVYDTTRGFMNGFPVAVAPTFRVSAGNVHISVVNNLVNPTSIIQNLSDLGFTVSTGQTSGGSLTGSSGLERNVMSNGTFADGSTVSTGWQLDNGQGFPFRVHVLG